MENRYTGRYVSSGDQKTEDEAWRVFLVEFVNVIREFPNASFGWRSTPCCITEREFESNSIRSIAYGRLIIDMQGEPVPLPQRIYEESISGFGLARLK